VGSVMSEIIYGDCRLSPILARIVSILLGILCICTYHFTNSRHYKTLRELKLVQSVLQLSGATSLYLLSSIHSMTCATCCHVSHPIQQPSQNPHMCAEAELLALLFRSVRRRDLETPLLGNSRELS
jgi:hypothetical protein